MLGGSSIVETEIRANTEFSERVVLPTPETPVISVTTTQEQLADYFEEYANLLGFNGVQARQFFRENVVFTFDIKEGFRKWGHPDLSFVDHALNKALMKLVGQPQFLGQVLTRKDGKLSTYVNLQGIAKEVLADKEGNDDLKTFQNKVNTITNHELRHVLQFMAESDKARKTIFRMVDNQKLFIGSVMGLVAGLAVPEILPQVLGGLTALKCFSLIIHGRKIDLEKDPLEAEKTDISKLQKRPFTFNPVTIRSNL